MPELGLLVYIVIVALIVGLLIWLIRMLPIDAMFKQIITAVIIVAAVIILLLWLVRGLPA